MLPILLLAVLSAVSISSTVDALKRGANVTIAGETICAARPLPLFYSRRGLRPAWSDGDAGALLDAIRRAADDGLDPAGYHLAAIETRQGEERDLLLTDAFFLLASHLVSGRVDPVTVEPTWCLEPRTADLVPALETALESHAVAETLQRFRPAHAGYRQLAAALAAHRRMQPWQPVEAGAALRAGATGPRVAQLTARLAASGDLPEPRAAFDADVETAVRRFQRRHGLDQDGVAGRRTLREMNVPLEARIRQLELNLERWRWLPAALGDRYAIINVPAFELEVVEGEQVVLSMRIIAGKDFDHRTPVFSSEIRQIVFSPYWNVPDRIAELELWPKQNRDHGFFAREHIQVLRDGRLRQTPGPWNALGSIKFDLPNRYAVYLHDTPARELFARTRRTFSHGCIRIEKPFELAALLLRDQPEWTAARITAQAEKGVEHAVRVRSPLPIHVLYWTAAVEDGEVRFAPDVYARDPQLDRAMRKRPERF